MQQASQQFSEQQRAEVDRAVAEAESKTSAEILPVVATASGRYDRPEDIVGLWLAMIGLIAVWILLPTAEAESGSWGGMPPWVKLVVMVAAAVAGFVLGAVIASRVGWLRRLFTPRQQMRDEVAARARTVFFDGRVHHTAGATGLLVYVSLYEHMAAVLADQSILDKLGQDAVDELCGVLTASLHEAHPAEAICRTVNVAGEKLAAVLPRADDDVNELPDALLTLDD